MTYLYAQYERKKYFSSNENLSNELLLKQLPNFTGIEISTEKVINSLEFLKGNNGIFVHIWGTWCAPCEKEMPEFLKYAESVSAKGIKFLLVAVSDEEMKVRKFMGKLKIPSNVTIVLDKENSIMDLFGTLKVPETFLFNSNGKHVNKFIGPQDWLQESYQTRLEFWLSTGNQGKRKIETH